MRMGVVRRVGARVARLRLRQCTPEQKRSLVRLRHQGSSNWNLANGLTVTRLGLAPVVAAFTVVGSNDAAVVGLAVAALSDTLDGIIARRWSQTTVLGSYLDPLADKALVNMSLGALAWRQVLPVELVCLVAGRDLLLVSGAFVVRYRQLSGNNTLDRFFRITEEKPLSVHPSSLGKLATILQLSLALAGVLDGAEYFHLEVPEPWWTVLVGSTGACTVLSGCHYLYLNIWNASRIYR
mmetsp:Transcript_15703/g.31651  ORF Transcript_15703/g.31651 Transcript_15703/m.31651 type:complete len:238 (-) Transcript_15703:1285-1998(-)